MSGLSVYDIELVSVISLLVADEREGCTGLSPTNGVFKNPLWVGADTKMQTQYLPAHCLIVLFGVNHTFAV